jgi:hypothetical protein
MFNAVKLETEIFRPSLNRQFMVLVLVGRAKIFLHEQFEKKFLRTSTSSQNLHEQQEHEHEHEHELLVHLCLAPNLPVPIKGTLLLRWGEFELYSVDDINKPIKTFKNIPHNDSSVGLTHITSDSIYVLNMGGKILLREIIIIDIETDERRYINLNVNLSSVSIDFVGC